jgi:AraC-like DNA-binding protein
MIQDPRLLTGTPELLQSALARLRLDGAIFFRAEFTEGFAFDSTPAEVAGGLHPGAERLILVHIVARGSCWVAGSEGDRHWVGQGDVIVVPYGDRHTIGGGGGGRTDLVCGYLYSEDPLFDPALRVFPSAFVVRLPEGAASGWVQASIAYALEATDPATGASLVSTRLPELVLIEVLRLHLASAPAADRGLLAALHDPVLTPALSLLHNQPGRRWTVAGLAAGAATSRSLLDERFRQVLGRSPIRYLTEWRMHLAQELLSTTRTGVAAVARRVGYDSEEAFSRAFKRATGQSPSHWRGARAASAGR